MLSIGVLVSGGGTNLQALIDACDSGIIKSGRISCVLSSREDAFALERARRHNIPCTVVSRKNHSGDGFDIAVADYLRSNNVDFVVLAGFMSILSKGFLREYEGRIINVHAALIPSFCGKGHYGIRVHEKALEYGVKITGATVHFVNELCDGGEIILQKAVEVREDDTPESLQRRVMEAEHIILPQAVEICCSGEYEIIGRQVRIRKLSRNKLQ